MAAPDTWPTPSSPGLPPPAAPAPPGWTPTAPPPAPLPPRRTPIYLGIAAAVIVVVVVLLLALLGVLPFFKSGGPNGSSFGDTRGPAQSTADGYPGGPWTLVLGAGIALHATTDISMLNTSTLPTSPSANCTVSRLSASSPTTIQGVGNVSQGLASSWAFLYRNPSGGLLAVSDFSGSFRVEGTASGPGCANSLGSYQPIPGGVIDSTAAAKAADGAGGYAFLQAHPSANGTIAIIGGITVFGFSVGSVWLVSYSACPIVNAVPTSQPAFTALVNASTGMVVQGSSSTMTCSVNVAGGHTPLGTELAVAPAAEATKGTTNWYNFTIQSAGGGLQLNNLAFQVRTSAGSIVALPGSSTLNVIGLTGATVGTYTISAGTWALGGSTAVSNQQEIVLTTPSTTSLSGDYLVVLGSGSFSGSIEAAIP